MRFGKYLGLAAIFVALVLLLSNAISAQSLVTGAIGGTVTDTSGAVVVGAKLTLTSAATGETFATASSVGGSYQFALLKPGTYTLTVTQPGFEKSSQTVEVFLGQTATVNLKLVVGSSSITVEVTEQGAMLQTEDANISSNFDTNQIQNTPNPGGDVTYIAQTAPGVTMNSSAGGGFGNFSAFGLPGTSNLFTVNGNDSNDAFLNVNNTGSSNLMLGGNELQEVAVVSNGYTGQYGRQAGAQVDFSTKSGSNSFHGNAVYNWTGRALNANDPLNKAGGNPRPFENNNAWAASVGGPILKDKLFFFANTEGIRYILASVTPVTVPTADFQSFVLANVAPQGAAVEQFYQNVFSLYNGAKGATNAVVNPNSCAGLPVASGDCTANYTEAAPNGNKEWLVSGRVDYNLDENNKIFGRVRFDHGVQPTYTDAINPIFNITSTQPVKDMQLNFTHVFTPTVANSFVGSILYYSAVFGNLNPGSALEQFPGILSFSDGSLTNLGIGSGLGGLENGIPYPQGRRVTAWQLIDDLSVARGNHSFKMGMNFRRDDVSDLSALIQTEYPAISINLAEFASNQIAPTGCSDPAVADCGATAFNFASHGVQPVAYSSLGLYFQDEYRVNTKLKLTMTLRADRNSGGVCQANCAGLPVTPFTDMAHGATIPYSAADGGSFATGNHTIIPGIEKVVFEPRLGFAWSPLGPNTVLRGGVGLFTDLYPGLILSAYDNNFPQTNLWNVPAGTVAFDTLAPGSTAFPGSGPSLVTQCNTAFLSNYNSGGSLTTGGSSGAGYQGAVAAIPGGCLNSLNVLSVPTLADVSRNLKNPKYIEWNFELQHTFGARTVVSANYVGNHGYDGLIFNNDFNGFGFANLPAAAEDPRVARVNFLENGGVSNYNGVTFSIQENVWHGLSGRLNYTYSHSLDDISNGGVLPFSIFSSVGSQIDPYNLSAQYASSDYDARHQISGSYVYQLPFKSENRLVNAAVGGWMISGTLFYRTGFPFSIIDGGASANLAGNNLAGSTILMQPDFAQRNFSNGAACVANPCFGPGTANTFAPSTSFLGSSRNSFLGPGFLGGDMSVRKNFAINERLTFQLSFNAYNWLNHANYGAPFSTSAGPLGSTVLTAAPPTSPYGAFALAATDMRMAQITAKLIF
jgi:hypothetical protein